jgi:TATA-box binding protein (TBP) (component of TFIID and TFIIIB)
MTTYEPELFPGLIFRLPLSQEGRKVTVLVFYSGKCVFTGARSEGEIEEAQVKLSAFLARK